MKIMNTGSKDNEFAEFMRLVGGGWLGAVCVAGGVGVFSGCLGGADKGSLKKTFMLWQRQ